MFRSKISDIVKILHDVNIFLNTARSISVSPVKSREVTNRKEMLRSLPAPDEGTVGEKAVDIDSSFRKSLFLYSKVISITFLPILGEMTLFQILKHPINFSMEFLLKICQFSI